ncbi:spidroin-2-like [Pomacea canaliculata]|uniref:spidroin-2-like n=1 Tax=Pomacea canaliculata TaxID=400727 RepID=UPI000D72C406|nr:spidroin-2-like [Pomacea canaliculata]
MGGRQRPPSGTTGPGWGLATTEARLGGKDEGQDPRAPPRRLGCSPRLAQTGARLGLRWAGDPVWHGAGVWGSSHGATGWGFGMGRGQEPQGQAGDRAWAGTSGNHRASAFAAGPSGWGFGMGQAGPGPFGAAPPSRLGTTGPGWGIGAGMAPQGQAGGFAWGGSRGFRHGLREGRTPRLAATGQAGGLHGGTGPRLARQASGGFGMGRSDECIIAWNLALNIQGQRVRTEGAGGQVSLHLAPQGPPLGSSHGRAGGSVWHTGRAGGFHGRQTPVLARPQARRGARLGRAKGSSFGSP